MSNLTAQQVQDLNTMGPVPNEVGLGTILLALQQAGGLSAGAVITAYLADGVLSADATGRAKMSDGFVNAAKLGSDAVTAAAILDGTITAAKLADPYEIDAGRRAMNVLRVASACKDAETITVGADVFEIDTDGSVAPGNILVNCVGGSEVAAQGTLTVDTIPTDGDTMTINGVTYRFKDIPAQADDINIEGTLGECQSNIVAAVNLSGTEGVEYYAGTQAAPGVSMAAFAANAAVVTADVPGTNGNAIATTETFTAGTNVFDAATLGTTTAGVDPTAGESSDAIIAAINASATEAVAAIDIAANEVLLIADTVGATVTACTETLAGANNGWAAAAMYGGAAASAKAFDMQSRAPTAVEVALGNMHFSFDFTPTQVIAQVRTTATGALVAWDGDIAIDSGNNVVTINNDGATDWSAAETVTVQVIGTPA